MFLKSYSEAVLTYLSLVILCVEEVCVSGQVYHCSDIVLGLVDDGQVEQPIDRDSKIKKKTFQCAHTTQTKQ